ncbi:putative tail assembly chaperone [Plesiomonas phage phiP4-7]|nr:putative tail assembly chaperone [Plesiomonas phage phiP4-7]
MASFRDYVAVQTATVELFHGESLQVRSVSSPEFMFKALPLHREKATKQDMTAEDETRINLGIAFALVESWTFDDDLTLENFIAMLESPAYAPITGEICKRIDRAGCNMDSFVKKKSVDLSNGLNEIGSLTDQPETAAKPDAKRSRKSTSKLDASRRV